MWVSNIGSDNSISAGLYHKRSSISSTHWNTLQYNAPRCTTFATHCNTLQHTSTHCNACQWHDQPHALQHIATHCNTLQHTATHWTHCNTLQHSAPHCTTLQHTATHYNTCQWLDLLYESVRFLPCHCANSAQHCNALHHTATHSNTLQHIPTHSHTLQLTPTHLHTLQCLASLPALLTFHGEMTGSTMCTAGRIQYTVSSFNTLQHTAAYCNTHHTEQYAHNKWRGCNALYHNATHCITLQHTQLGFVSLNVLKYDLNQYAGRRTAFWGRQSDYFSWSYFARRQFPSFLSNVEVNPTILTNGINSFELKKRTKNPKIWKGDLAFHVKTRHSHVWEKDRLTENCSGRFMNPFHRNK